jgi:hypothetical protein
MAKATRPDFRESMGDPPFMDRVRMRVRGPYVVELAYGYKPDPDGDRWYHETTCGRVIVHKKVEGLPRDYYTIGAERCDRPKARDMYEDLRTQEAIAAWAAEREDITGV